MVRLPIFLLILMMALLLPSSHAIFGMKKKNDKKRSGKDSAEMGLDAFEQAFADPQAFQDIMQMAKDPELMREVEELMDDPEFQAYMDEYMNRPGVKESMKMAEEIANDPQKLKAFQDQLMDALAGDASKYTGGQNAQLGLNTLAQSVQDPNVMAEAMNLLNDPKIAAEVEQMMKDPAFQREMRRITESPEFKEAMEKSKEMLEELQNDPRKMKEFMRDLEGSMKQFQRNEL